MNNKQAKRLRRMGFDTKKAKKGFQALSHTQKRPVLEAVSQMQWVESLEKQLAANLEKVENKEVAEA